MNSKTLNITLYAGIIVSMILAVFMRDAIRSFDVVRAWMLFSILTCVLRFIIFNYVANVIYIKKQNVGVDCSFITKGNWFLIASIEDFESFIGISIISIYGLFFTIICMIVFFGSLYLSLNPDEIPSFYNYGAESLFYVSICVGIFYALILLFKSKFRRL